MGTSSSTLWSPAMAVSVSSYTTLNSIEQSTSKSSSSANNSSKSTTCNITTYSSDDQNNRTGTANVGRLANGNNGNGDHQSSNVPTTAGGGGTRSQDERSPTEETVTRTMESGPSKGARTTSTGSDTDVARANADTFHLIQTNSISNTNINRSSAHQQPQLGTTGMTMNRAINMNVNAPTNTPTPMPIPKQFLNDALAAHIHRDLPQHTIELKMGPESGRMTSTYRIRHVPSGAVMVLKVMILSITAPLNTQLPDSNYYSSSATSTHSEEQQYSYGSITQHELLLQEQEMKRMLLLVADNNNNNNNKNCHDFTHGILPYQSWYISPFIMHSTTSSAPARATATRTVNNTPANATTSSDTHTNSSSSSNPPASPSSISNNNNHISRNNNYITQKRPIYLLRAHVYTTLSIKIITRPFLSNAEKMYIAHQIISCVHTLHHKLKLCHGHLSCENIGLTSFNSVYLLDLMPVSGGANTFAGNNNRAVRPLLIPDDDPSDWIYYFQERVANANSTKNTTSGDSNTVGSTNTHKSSTKNNLSSFGGGSGEKKCYIAPERFVSRSSSSSSSVPTKLTPAMDIFSLGCVLMELFLNGETAMDLGDLMEYRRINGNIAEHSTLSKRLNKIESGKMRAAVRNMLNLNPDKRLCAEELLNRLVASKNETPNSDGATPCSKDGKTSINNSSKVPTAIAPFPYCHESVYFPLMKHLRCQIVSSDARIALAACYYEKVIYATIGVKDSGGGAFFRRVVGPTMTKLFSQLEGSKNNKSHDECIESMEEKNDKNLPYFSLLSFEEFLPAKAAASSSSSDSLVIFVQFILSTIRHTQRPSSKIVGLQLLGRISKFTADEVRLQRIVPTIVSILHDTDATVRAMSITILTAVLSCVDHFPPSDAQVFPQYIFIQISHLINDPALLVRVAFTESIALLAETALRFLETCHAIKLYETVESPSEEELTSSQGFHKKDKTNDYSQNTSMIRNDYDNHLSDLQEIVAKWVISITTDTSNYASALKQALLKDITRLCHFFGHEGIMACILPQVLAFLNHRRDWQLRAALCQHLPSICVMIGRAATEQFVVPCIETALFDDEERVVASAMFCLGSLVEMGLVTRKMLLGVRSKTMDKNIAGIIEKYSRLLVDPSDNVRYATSFFIATCCRSVRFPDDEVFVIPILRPYLRYDIQRSRLQTSDGIMSCLKPPSPGQTSPLNSLRCLCILNGSIEGVQKAAFACYVHNQKYAELLSKPSPIWYQALKQCTLVDTEPGLEISSLRDLSTLSQVYAVSLLQSSHFLSQKYLHKNQLNIDPGLEMLQNRYSSEKILHTFLCDPLSQAYNAAIQGEWGAESTLDPSIVDIYRDVSKLVSLKVPPKPPTLGSLRNREGRAYSCHTPVTLSFNEMKKDLMTGTEWTPQVDCLTCASGPNEHNGPVNRLTVSQDQYFFVSGSNDGTCKVWETMQILNTAGHLSSTLTYSGHCNSDSSAPNYQTRVNDLCIMENSHAVASADSAGAVHIWRVDTFSKNSSSDYSGMHPKISGVSGSTMLRKVDPCEGEIFSISHFNTPAASLITFATQRGIHSWDLRCSYEPFFLEFQSDYGHLTSMAIGSDRNWIVAGSNRGYLALWDIRFQKLVKLWQHESCAPVNRLGTSFTNQLNTNESKPLVAVGCGLNEMSIFDLSRGNCTNCFRILDPEFCYIDQSALPNEVITLPSFREENICSRHKGRVNGMNESVNRVLLGRIPSPEPSIQAFTWHASSTNKNFLLSGGSDGYIHYWNLQAASKCFAVSGSTSTTCRPVYEKVGFNRNTIQGALYLCRQYPFPKLNEMPSSNISKVTKKGPTRPDNLHRDAILDLKILDFPMKGILSSSRDSMIKFWR